MKHLILTAFLLILGICGSLSKSAVAAPPHCREWLTAYNLYERMEKGEIVLKHNTTDIEDWMPADEFTGIVLKKPDVKNPVLELEYRAIKGSVQKKAEFTVVEPYYDTKTNWKRFAEFRGRRFFVFQQEGTFWVRLKSGSKIVCEQKHKFLLGD